VLPWHLRLAQLTGDPFYNASSLLYHDTATFPGWTSSRTLAVRDLTPLGFVRAHPGEVAHKMLLDGIRFARDLVLFPTPFLAPFLWLAFRRPGTAQARALVVGGGVSAVVLALALVPLEYAPRFLAPLVPWLTIGAVLGLSRFPRWRKPLVAVGTAAALLVLGATLAGRGGSTGTAALAAEDANALHGERGVVLSDAPTLVAWIWERPAVWAPVPEDLAEVRALLPGCVALFTRATGRGDGIDSGTLERYRDGEPGTLPAVVRWDPAANEGALPR
jgi:hypothetical protein